VSIAVIEREASVAGAEPGCGLPVDPAALSAKEHAADAERAEEEPSRALRICRTAVLG